MNKTKSQNFDIQEGQQDSYSNYIGLLSVWEGILYRLDKGVKVTNAEITMVRNALKKAKGALK